MVNPSPVIRCLRSAVCGRRYSSDATSGRKVAILGAAGGIGQPLSMLMKLNPHVSSLSLYDIAATPGVAADVSHVNTRAQVGMNEFMYYDDARLICPFM